MAESIGDLVEQLPQIEQQMARWWERYSAMLRRLEQEYERMRKGGRFPGLSEFQRSYAGIARKAREETDPAALQKIYTYLDQLCLAYLSANATQCTQARQAMGQAPRLRGWLPVYVDALAEQIRSQADENRLHIGLAALSLEDATYMPGLTPRYEEDYRNISTSLNPLREAAERAGLDIVPHLKTVAALSSDQPSWVSPKSPSVQYWLNHIAGNIEQERQRAARVVTCPEMSPMGTTALPLAVKTVARGQVTGTVPIIVYQFQAKHGQFVTIKMRRASGNLMPFLGLVDVRGNILSYGSGANPVSIERFYLPADGCYYIYAAREGLSDGDSEGEFELIAGGW